MYTSMKRSRAPNFTAEEKMLCLNLVNNHIHILENKQTDATSWKEKELVWAKITKEFNMQSPGLVARTKENLKNFYENKKKEVRKWAAKERMEMFKTGGGPSSLTSDPMNDFTLSIMNKKSVCGLKNPFDGDKTNNETIVFMVENDIVDDENIQNTNMKLQILILSPIIKVKIHDIFNMEKTRSIADRNSDWVEHCLPSTLENDSRKHLPERMENNLNWNNCSAQLLKSKLSEQLTPATPEGRNARISRTRPAFNSTSNLAQKYEELARVKMEIATIQLAMVKKEAEIQSDKCQKDAIEEEEKKKRTEREMAMRMKHFEEEHSLKKQAIMLDIEIKKSSVKTVNRVVLNK